MTLPELSIKRHVLAWMLSAVLVLFGVISYDRIGMDRYPYIEFPVVSIKARSIQRRVLSIFNRLHRPVFR